MEKRLAEVEKESFAAAEKILMGPTVDGCYRKITALKNEIEKTDSEIDKMVYELYGLTKEEIEIIRRAAN